MKKICMFVLSMFLGLSALNAANQTTESTIVEDLKCFYTRLDKESLYILDTDKFMCSSSGCTSSIFEKVGIISTYEYKNIGGNSSYLVSREPFVTLNNTGYDLATSTEIINNEGNGALKPSMYLQEGVRVRGSGTKKDPWILIPNIKSVNLYASINDGELTSDFPSRNSTYLYNGYYCDKDVDVTINEDIYSENLDKVVVNSYYENKKCVIKYKDGYKVTLKFTNNVIEDKYIIVGSSLTNKIEKPTNSDYTWEEADISCEEGINVTVDEEYIKATDIRKDGTCTITLKELPSIGLSVKNGSVINGPSNKRVSYLGDNISFTVSANDGYKLDGATVTCNNGSTPSIENNMIKFSDVRKSDTCVVNMAVDMFRVTLNVTNGVSDANYNETEKNGNVSFTITPNDEYELVLSSDSCNGKLNGNVYTVSNVTSSKTCNISLKHKVYTWAMYKYVTTPAGYTEVNTSVGDINFGPYETDSPYTIFVNVPYSSTITGGKGSYYKMDYNSPVAQIRTNNETSETVTTTTNINTYCMVNPREDSDEGVYYAEEIYKCTSLTNSAYSTASVGMTYLYHASGKLSGCSKITSVYHESSTTKEFVQNVTSENKSAYPTDGDMNGYYYKLIS